MTRIVANQCSVNSQKIRNCLLEEEDYKSIGLNAENISNYKLKIDTKTMYIEELEQIIALLKSKNEIDVLIIDYLSLLKSKQRYTNRELEVSEISRKLKLMSLEYDIAIIVLVQLNREAENKKPTMATIRESGTIEQNCDNIIFLYNDNEEKAINDMEVILAKQRQGQTGTVRLKFDKKYNRFVNYER